MCYVFFAFRTNRNCSPTRRINRSFYSIKIKKNKEQSSQLNDINERETGVWMFEHATNQSKTWNKKTEFFLHVCLVNWLNHTTNEQNYDLWESITSQSASIGYQGIKMRTKTMNGADSHAKTESCNLSLIFHMTPNMYNDLLKNYEVF